MFLSSGVLQDGRSMCEWEFFHIGGVLIQGPSKLNTWLAVAKQLHQMSICQRCQLYKWGIQLFLRSPWASKSNLPGTCRYIFTPEFAFCPFSHLVWKAWLHWTHLSSWPGRFVSVGIRSKQMGHSLSLFLAASFANCLTSSSIWSIVNPDSPPLLVRNCIRNTTQGNFQ